jgi:hypothetical protein
MDNFSLWPLQWVITNNLRKTSTCEEPFQIGATVHSRDFRMADNKHTPLMFILNKGLINVYFL